LTLGFWKIPKKEVGKEIAKGVGIGLGIAIGNALLPGVGGIIG